MKLASILRPLLQPSTTHARESVGAVKKTNLYTERNEKKRQQFLKEIAVLNPEDIVYIDESGIDEIMHRAYAKCPKNTRAYGEKTGKHVPRTTLIAGYVEGGFIAPLYFKGYTNTGAFNCWVKTCLLASLRPGQVVVMDNASFHKSKETIQLIESVGCRVLFQPPYSPDLNKIEQMWANLKNRIRNCNDCSLSFFQKLETNFNHMCLH